MTVNPISGSSNADEDIFRLTGPIESAKNNALLELQQPPCKRKCKEKQDVGRE